MIETTVQPHPPHFRHRPADLREPLGWRVWLAVALAPLLVGSLTALTNLANFVVARPVYFAIWGAAHLLAFGCGLSASLLWREGKQPLAYVLGLTAGGVEALIVFAVIDGATLATDASGPSRARQRPRRTLRRHPRPAAARAPRLQHDAGQDRAARSAAPSRQNS